MANKNTVITAALHGPIGVLIRHQLSESFDRRDRGRPRRASAGEAGEAVPGAMNTC